LIVTIDRGNILISVISRRLSAGSHHRAHTNRRALFRNVLP